MKKTVALLLIVWGLFRIASYGQTGGIQGTVTDSKGEPLVNATVLVSEGGIRKGGSVTDLDGHYIVKPLAAGSYDVRISSVGFNAELIQGVQVANDLSTTVNAKLQRPRLKSKNSDKRDLKEVVVRSTRYVRPLIEIRQEGSRSVLAAQEIEKMPVRNVTSQGTTTTGVLKSGRDAGLNVSGGQAENTVVIVDGVLQPGQRTDAGDESYPARRENEFLPARSVPLSTLAVDVDRASYSNVRRYLNDGQKPPVDAVRVEEMVNYFDYNYAGPRGRDPIAIHTEVSECPWNKANRLLHIGLQARKVDASKLPPSNLVFLIDVSGSMQSPNKLPLVQSALALLVANLRDVDRVAIVVYAGQAGLVLPSTPGTNRAAILNALNGLEAGGSTAGGEGIVLAYKTAQDAFIKGGNNRVILATDGDFNVGVSSNSDLETLISGERDKGVFLTCLGFGMGNYKDDKLQILADKGNGNHAYIDNIQEAQKTLVAEFGGTLFTVAKDVKAQIEFNPAVVRAYRLIGYENRLLNAEDFLDDRKDAGEMGAGHTVTILYELVPVGTDSLSPQDAIQLKYQKTGRAEDADPSGELATVKFRYKDPDGSVSRELVHPIADQVSTLDQASTNLRFSASVALFGLLLEESRFKAQGTLQTVVSLAETARGEDRDGYRAEFIRLAKSMH